MVGLIEKPEHITTQWFKDEGDAIILLGDVADANDPLRGAELENLVEDLRRCAMPYTCPHGRPTLIEMNYRELEKKFGRSN